MKYTLSILFVYLFITSCKPPVEGEVLAEAYGNVLYAHEVEGLLPEHIAFEDSVLLVKEHINVWVAKQVVLHQAETILNEQEKDKSKQLEEYKNDLLIYEVLNKVAASQLDTSFEKVELEEYYNEHIDEFELSQNILKLNFFKIPETSEDVELLWSNFKADDQSIYPKLLTLSKDGGNYYMDNESWVYFDDILKEIPIDTYNQEHYLNNNKYIRLKDKDYVYFVKIIDFKIRSSTSPFSMEEDNIRNILLMKRQQALIQTIETNWIEDAYKQKKIQKH